MGAPLPGGNRAGQEIVAAMPGVEMVRMVNSGTEATMKRPETGPGRNRQGQGHQVCRLLPRPCGFIPGRGRLGRRTLSIPGTPRRSPRSGGRYPLAPYNDLDAVTELFSRHGEKYSRHNSRACCGQYGPGSAAARFSEGLRKLCDEYRALLILTR